jgi:hypothetical protein
VLVWIAVFLAFGVIAGAKYGRFFVSAMPAFLLLAGHASERLASWAAARLRSRPRRISARAAAIAAMGLVLAVPEARAAISHAPHNRLYLNALAGGDRNVTWFLPHCDYFDAGVREALAWIAAHAERGAEVASEVDWTVRLYSTWYGRPDLVSSPILPGRGCGAGQPCYVVVQPGRVYWHNEAALDRLAATAPVHTERVRGTDAVRVYRLAPGERLFPPEAPVADGMRVR